MKTFTVAFDCDGTLIRDGAMDDHEIRANERMRTLLIILASFKNVKIVVWSGGGELWARQVGAAIGINKYVDSYASKNRVGVGANATFEPDIKPDIAIDDVQACELGIMNLICKEK